MGDPWQWYQDIPVVSRCYLTASFLTTAACAMDLVSPFSLYFNFGLIVYKGQVRSHSPLGSARSAYQLELGAIEACHR